MHQSTDAGAELYTKQHRASIAETCDNDCHAEHQATDETSDSVCDGDAITAHTAEECAAVVTSDSSSTAGLTAAAVEQHFIERTAGDTAVDTAALETAAATAGTATDATATVSVAAADGTTASELTVAGPVTTATVAAAAIAEQCDAVITRDAAEVTASAVEATAVCSSDDATAAAAATTKKLKAVTAQLEELEERSACVVCQHDPKQALPQPCLHLCLCIKCSISPKIIDCPICRAAMDSKEIVHMC